MNNTWKKVLGVVAAIAEATGITQAQVFSWLKTALGIVGSSLATSGVVNAATWQIITGVVVALFPLVWGYFANTILAQVKSTSALLDVDKVVLKTSAGGGLATAAADPNQPKIVKQ
jgi:hypothetical protein